MVDTPGVIDFLVPCDKFYFGELYAFRNVRYLVLVPITDNICTVFVMSTVAASCLVVIVCDFLLP